MKSQGPQNVIDKIFQRGLHFLSHTFDEDLSYESQCRRAVLYALRVKNVDAVTVTRSDFADSTWLILMHAWKFILGRTQECDPLATRLVEQYIPDDYETSGRTDFSDEMVTILACYLGEMPEGFINVMHHMVHGVPNDLSSLEEDRK